MKYLIITYLLFYSTLAFAGFIVKDDSVLKYHDEDGVRYIDDSKTLIQVNADLKWRSDELDYAQKQFNEAKEWSDAVVVANEDENP